MAGHEGRGAAHIHDELVEGSGADVGPGQRLAHFRHARRPGHLAQPQSDVFNVPKERLRAVKQVAAQMLVPGSVWLMHGQSCLPGHLPQPDCGELKAR